MIWVAISIFAVGIIYFSIHYPQVRKWLGIVAAVAIALVACAALYVWIDARETERKSQLAKKLIRENEIQISNAVLSLGVAGKLEASVKNNSPYSLASLSLKVSVTDCPKIGDLYAKNARCNIVGENTATDWTINIPPHQVRQFSAYPTFSNLPDLQAGGWSWSYTIAEIRGDLN